MAASVCRDLQYDTAAGGAGKLFWPRPDYGRPPAAGDIIGYVLWRGRERSDCCSRIPAAHHLHIDPCCATSSLMATVTSEFAGELRGARPMTRTKEKRPVPQFLLQLCCARDRLLFRTTIRSGRTSRPRQTGRAGPRGKAIKSKRRQDVRYQTPLLGGVDAGADPVVDPS